MQRSTGNLIQGRAPAQAVFRCVIGWILCVGCLAMTSSASADDDVWTILLLNADKEKWAERIDLPMKIEGRVSAVSKHQFRFVHCDLTFHVSEDQSRAVGNVRNVEVSGRFKKDKETGKLVFAVDRVKILPSDVEQFELNEARLKSTKAADWYELAEWAASRGRFYDDDELAGKARRARLKGLQFERQALPENDAEARFALAAKFREHKAEDRLAAELVHEGARLNWQRAKNNAEDRSRFADWLKKTYPDCIQPLDSIPAELDRRYETHPLETYRAAEDASRKTLMRLWYIQVELARIMSLEKADGGNATAIADALADRIPERTDLIEKYREMAFQWRLKSIASASRQEALRLAEELKAKKQPAQAQDLLRGWIRSREERLRKDGPIGLMQLAEDFLQLVEDEPAAVKLLAEAHQLDPSFSDPAERLKQLGYHQEQNRWKKGEATESPTTPGKAPSQLAVGMTADDVLSLLGAPSAKSRILTTVGIQEVWSFGRRGTPRLLIHLQRSTPAATPRVTRYLTEGSH